MKLPSIYTFEAQYRASSGICHRNKYICKAICFKDLVSSQRSYFNVICPPIEINLVNLGGRVGGACILLPQF